MAKVKKSVSVQAPVDLVYRAWHNFENFPRFMDNIQEVRNVSGGRSHWKTKGPLGTNVEWDAEVTMDQPNEAIGWRSIQGAESGLKTAGRVNFKPAGNETQVEVTIEYEPPAGAAGEAVAKVFSNPERQVEEDLQRFKDTIEKGVELSGFDFGTMEPAGGTPYGGSMNVTEEQLENIAGSNSGIAPTGVDDPARRGEE